MRDYHYIITKTWVVLKARMLDTPVGSTMNREANRLWVQIALIGNFNNFPPTKEQIIALKQLVKDIRAKKWELVIKLHRDVGITACPGKLFEIEKYDLWQYKSKGNETIFSLSRYYSPMPNQKRYYNNKTYQEDLTMNTSWDPLITANWHKLVDWDRWKSVACDKKYLWKKLFLEDVWIVTCNDVWWAIKWNRIDMRCGMWDGALDNWNTCPTGQRLWHRIE
jgi:hypothetical protein